MNSAKQCAGMVHGIPQDGSVSEDWTADPNIASFYMQQLALPEEGLQLVISHQEVVGKKYLTSCFAYTLRSTPGEGKMPGHVAYSSEPDDKDDQRHYQEINRNAVDQSTAKTKQKSCSIKSLTEFGMLHGNEKQCKYCIQICYFA